MTLEYVELSGQKRHDKAISVCLYRSAKFNPDKHIQPLAEFVAEGQEGYDILVFREPGMEVPSGPTTRVFDVTSFELGYERHLWRYIGGELGYGWTFFRGADTPSVPVREQRLADAAVAVQSEVLIWQCPDRRPVTCMGRCGVSEEGGKNLLSYLRQATVNPRDWNCDEVVLSNWIEQTKPRVTLALDGPLSNKPHQLSWVISRLCEGNHTTIIKDRDDRR